MVSLLFFLGFDFPFDRSTHKSLLNGLNYNVSTSMALKIALPPTVVDMKLGR